VEATGGVREDWHLQPPDSESPAIRLVVGVSGESSRLQRSSSYLQSRRCLPYASLASVNHDFSPDFAILCVRDFWSHQSREAKEPHS